MAVFWSWKKGKMGIEMNLKQVNRPFFQPEQSFLSLQEKLVLDELSFPLYVKKG